MLKKKELQLFEVEWAQHNYPEECCGTCKYFSRCKEADGDAFNYPCMPGKGRKGYSRSPKYHRFVEV